MSQFQVNSLGGNSAGQILQTVIYSTAALSSTLTTSMSYDENDLPISTDGNPVWATLSITPKSSSSTLLIQSSIILSGSTGNPGICIFDGVNHPAIGFLQSQETATEIQPFNFLFKYTPAATGELTFSIAIVNLAGSADNWVNGDNSGNPIGGGANWSTVIIQELLS